MNFGIRGRTSLFVDTDEESGRHNDMISIDDTDQAQAARLVDERDIPTIGLADRSDFAVTRQLSPRLLRGVLVGADLFAVVLGLVVAVRGWGRPIATWSDEATTTVLAAIAVAWIVAFSFRRMYTARFVERPGEEAKRAASGGLLTLGGLLFACYAGDVALPERSWVFASFLAVTGLVLLERALARIAFRHLRSKGRLARRVALVGTDGAALALYDSIQSSPVLGYEVVGLIGTGECVAIDRPMLGDIDHAVDALKAHDCVGAIVSISSLTMNELNRLTRTLTDAKLHVALSTSLTDIDLHRLRPQGLDGHAMLYVEPAVRSGWRSVAKRMFDLAVAGTMLTVTLPITVLAAIAIKLDSRGPVLFRQVRIGRDGLPFEMLKFRTMHQDAELMKRDLLARNEADGPLFKMSDDPRITRVGRFLRKWSIDELPQLWNVLRDDMSMVGPRPALAEEVADWDRELQRRLCVPPGITGEWQVSGRSDTSFAEYRRLDLHYVDNWRLGHDLKVCLKTVWAVLRADGAR